MLTLDPLSRTATLDQRAAVLTHREFGVLVLLHDAAGSVVAHDTLLGTVWGAHTPRANLRVAIAGLRRKLEADPELPARILAVTGQGYRLAGARDPTQPGTPAIT